MVELYTEPDVKKIVVVGHVDHGKSTLLGRIMLDTGKIPADKVEAIRKTCEEKRVVFEPAFFFDALQEEQEQGISIDTTRVNFDFEGHRFLLIDAPGHIEFLKNMTSGASEAEQGIVMVDCVEGIRNQTGRHLKVLSILGIREVIIVVNKLDKIGYDEKVFNKLATDLSELAEAEGLRCLSVVPISALLGENITKISDNMKWYEGLPLLPLILKLKEDTLDFTTGAEPFRMVLQDVYKFNDKRYFAGRVMSGELTPGMEVFFSPSGKVSKIASIETFPASDKTKATKGESVAICLTEQIFVERGEVVSSTKEIPEVETELVARVVWLSSDPYRADDDYLLKIGTNEVNCKVSIITTSGATKSQPSMNNGDIFDVKITADSPIAFDRLLSTANLNKLVLCSKYDTVAAGVINLKAPRIAGAPVADPNVIYEQGYVQRAMREQQNGHEGTVLWLTGLSGAGKSTLAKALERYLFNTGYKVVVLDGDNMRTGLNADLGFSAEDRSENIRRISNVAKIFLDTGFITVVACISPYEQDRECARKLIGDQDFTEIFMFCPLEVCQSRDPKGLYKKVSTGQVSNLTGMSSPYQSPVNPHLRLDSSRMTTMEEVSAVIDLLASKGVVKSEALVSQGAAPVSEAAPPTR
ncbi:MAG: adenylyl-sulfate kinase [Candidatus Melainabacteria bacterium]|nr:adenylyl-sulfate kinase [Candidatus Melainabacteria bacterium]